MKILGFNIEWSKPADPVGTGPSKLTDSPVNVKSLTPGASSRSVATIPTVKNPAFTYMSLKGFGRGLFEPSEYELSQIGRIEDTESYVRQAFKKKIGLMFKEGYDFVGKNPNTIKYVKTRLAQLAKASSLPTNELMRIVGSGLIKKSNTFLVKVRKREASGGREYKNANGKTLAPIAAYFVIPAETMNVDADEYGRIRKWRQWMPGRHLYQHWNPEDIVHFYFDKKDGFQFGTPTLIPVIDDIRSLRKIEENIELLVYQHLFPLFHYKVGTEKAPAGVTEDGLREVDVVRQMIQYMPTEGGIVTPERHEISMIGAEGRALHAEGYLEHFKKRVFAGLGVSAVDMGEGETANRATADNMSRALIDDVKDFQNIVETQFDEFIIKELLLESTFGESVLDEENMVHLKFYEIDIDKRIKLETHAADQFTKHAITWSEVRAVGGREPIPHPQDDQEENDPTQFPEWNNTFWKLFEEPKALIQAIDEPYSAAALAAAENKGVGISSENVQQAGEQQVAAEVKKIKAKPKPAARKKDSISDARHPDFLASLYQNLEQDVVSNLNDPKMRFDMNYIARIANAQATRMTDLTTNKCISAFISGYASSGRNLSPEDLSSFRAQITQRATKYINRLVKHLTTALERQVDKATPDDKISTVRSVFSALSFRTGLISDVEIRKAYNYGRLLGFKSAGHSTIQFKGKDANCDQCKAAHNTKNHVHKMDLEDVPPFHASCSCELHPEEVS